MATVLIWLRLSHLDHISRGLRHLWCEWSLSFSDTFFPSCSFSPLCLSWAPFLPDLLMMEAQVPSSGPLSSRSLTWSAHSVSRLSRLQEIISLHLQGGPLRNSPLTDPGLLDMSTQVSNSHLKLSPFPGLLSNACPPPQTVPLYPQPSPTRVTSILLVHFSRPKSWDPPPTAWDPAHSQTLLALPGEYISISLPHVPPPAATSSSCGHFSLGLLEGPPDWSVLNLGR